MGNRSITETRGIRRLYSEAHPQRRTSEQVPEIQTAFRDSFFAHIGVCEGEEIFVMYLLSFCFGFFTRKCQRKYLNEYTHHIANARYCFFQNSGSSLGVFPVLAFTRACAFTVHAKRVSLLARSLGPNLVSSKTRSKPLQHPSHGITNLRDLKFQINSTSLDQNSIETCQTLCAQAGYKISAVQFG